MKVITLKIHLLSLLFLLPVSSSACSCSDVPDSFIESIHSNHIIVAAEVLGHIDEFSSAYRSATKLAVFKWYQNKMSSDTIYFANGSSGMCSSSIRSWPLGSKLILKAVRENYAYSKYENVIEYYICDVSILNFIDGKVVGDITMSFRKRRYNLERLANLFSKKWASKLRHRNYKNPKFQKMRFKGFGRLLAIRWDDLYK